VQLTKVVQQIGNLLLHFLGVDYDELHAEREILQLPKAAVAFP
jgi:hypothetical protein